MALFYSSYFGLARVTESGPEAKNWAVVNTNPEIISKLLYQGTQHRHTAATPIYYPGYNWATPATPTTPNLSVVSGDGVLSPGAAVGVRMTYVDSYGLETNGSPEVRISLPQPPSLAEAPSLSTPHELAVGTALKGGTYVYGITKVKGTGETQLGGVVTATVPFASTENKSYQIRLNFPAHFSYEDGATGLKIYRSTGLTSNFVLLKSMTSATTPWDQFIDTNVIEDTTAQPPTINMFDRNRAVNISFGHIATPPSARYRNIYVTQNPGVYGNTSLLNSIDLSTPTGQAISQVTYLGSENLTAGYPPEFSQIPSMPAKIVLQDEATGAPVLTRDMDFAGFKANKFVLGDQTSAFAADGNIYYDTSSKQVKVRINGSYQTLATPTGAFVHSNAEPGGHSASNIFFSSTQGGPSVYTVLSAFATPVAAGAQWRKQIQTYQRATITTANYTTTSSTLGALPETTLGAITPQFAGQLLEMSFSGAFLLDPQTLSNAQLNAQFEINGSTSGGAAETYRSVSPAGATPVFTNLNIIYATPISATVNSIRILWAVSAGKATSFGPRRTTLAKLVA